MVSLAGSGESISSIARTLGTSRHVVLEWLARFKESGMDGLTDLERAGRPAKISSLERHQVIALACKSPKDYSASRNVWTHELLSEVLVRKKLVREISSSEVGRILFEAELKPHLVKGWCHSKDPQFEEKMRDIVELYVNHPRGEPVLCVDEKTGMQALSRARELVPAAPGISGRNEFEYRRNGTRCLFACFNIGTGHVLGRCTTSRKRDDFMSFMDFVAATYRQRYVHIVLDNLNTHRDTTQGAFITEWNRRHGNRFIFHYTPTHGSWLNQVELWFSVLSRRILRYGNFHSTKQLEIAVRKFIQLWNTKEGHPFRWTYEGLPLVK